MSIPFRNRTAQGDYVADQLQLRQTELQFQRTINQVRVRCEKCGDRPAAGAARDMKMLLPRANSPSRVWLRNTNKFQFGTSDVATVIQAQKDLATNQSSEVQALVNYTHAKINYDEALGQTLDVNHVSIEEATKGHVARESILPATLPSATPEKLTPESKQ